MIVIHIGLRKAGSTTIQRFLHVNREALRKIGIHYPKIGQTNRPMHQNISREVLGHIGFDPAMGTLAQLGEYWHDADGDVMILSSEEFEAYETAHVATIREAFAEVDDTFRIVLLIRDLVDLIPSGYWQKTSTGENILDFDTFFNRRMRQRRVDFFQIAKSWADSFGWESILIRLLDREHLLNGDLTDDFLAIAGLQPGGDGLADFKRPGVRNASPGWRVREAVRALYNGGHGLPAGHPLIADALVGSAERKSLGHQAHDVGEHRGWNADRGQYMTRAQAQACLEIYSRTVVALNEVLSYKVPLPLELDARGFVERGFMPEARHIPPDELREFYDEVAMLRKAARPRGDRIQDSINAP